VDHEKDTSLLCQIPINDARALLPPHEAATLSDADVAQAVREAYALAHVLIACRRLRLQLREQARLRVHPRQHR
jgi:hypothetical protein